MQSARGLPVPSPGHLRLLRSQSETLSFFITNHSTSLPQFRPLCRQATLLRCRAYNSTRLLSTSIPRQITIPPAPLSDIGFLRGTFQRRRRRDEPSRIPPASIRSFHTTSIRRDEYLGEKPESPKLTWRRILWGSGVKDSYETLEPGDLSTEGTVFSGRRMLSAKAASEPRLRCTEVDENGQVILVDGEFKKTELIAKYGLLPRDLRKIDSSNLPHILVRPSAILLNLLHLKVLIKRDRVLLFDVYGSETSYAQSAFMYDLQGRLQQKGPTTSTLRMGSHLPYEFRALEAVLTSVTTELELEFEAVRDPVIRILRELEDDIDQHKLRILLILSKRVSNFEQKAKLVRDAIEEQLDADDDLAAMYLTEKAHDLYRALDDHTEVEMLLESYHKLCDEVVQEAQSLVTSIRNTEEIVGAILDANRNALMVLDLKFTIGTLGLAMGTFLAGLYGMNLENFIEETSWGFASVTGVSFTFSLLVCWYGLIKLRKIRRVRIMRGESGDLNPGRGAGANRHWFQEDMSLDMREARNREKLRRMQIAQKAMGPTKRWM